jgi:uncharacterized membrane protein
LPKRKPATAGSDAEIRFGQKWLPIAGIAILVLGFGYFLKLSFDNNWVTPTGRVCMAYLVGGALLAIGEMFRRKGFSVYGLYLVGGGIATLYASTYAAYGIYELLSVGLAFPLMVAITALACGLALFYDVKWLSVLGLIGGFATPMVLSTGKPNFEFLMAYITVLNAGVLSIALFKRWKLLHNLGFFFTWLLYTAGLFSVGWKGDIPFWTALIYANIFFLMYTLVPYGYHLRTMGTAKLSEFAIALPNALIAFAYSYALIQDEHSRQAVSVLTIAYAMLYLGLAQWMHRHNAENKTAVVMLLAKASIFLVATVPILFSGNWITMFWAIEALVLLWAANKLDNRILFGGSLAVLALAVAKFVLHDYTEIFLLNENRLLFAGGFKHLLMERWTTTVLLLSAVFGYNKLIAKATYLPARELSQSRAFFHIVFATLLFLVANIEVAAFFNEYAPDATLASISVLWTFFSIALMVLGFMKNQKILRQTSIALFILTILKVFFQDMADIATPYKVLSLVVLGTMMIAASYPYHRYASRILAKVEEKEAQS